MDTDKRVCAWYSPELDAIVFQQIIDECEICFEWSWKDCFELNINWDCDPMQEYVWIYLGEV